MSSSSAQTQSSDAAFQGALLEAKLLETLTLSFQIHAEINKNEYNLQQQGLQFSKGLLARLPKGAFADLFQTVFTLPKLVVLIEEFVGYEFSFEADLLRQNVNDITDTDASIQDDITVTSEAAGKHSLAKTNPGTIADLESYHVESMELQDDIQDLSRTVRALEWDLKQCVWFSESQSNGEQQVQSAAYARFEYAAKRHQFARQAMAANRIKSNRTEYLVKNTDLKQAMIIAVTKRCSELEEEINALQTMQVSLLQCTQDILQYDYTAAARAMQIQAEAGPTTTTIAAGISPTTTTAAAAAVAAYGLDSRLQSDLIDDIAAVHSGTDSSSSSSSTAQKSIKNHAGTKSRNNSSSNSSSSTRGIGAYQKALLGKYEQLMTAAVESYPDIERVIAAYHEEADEKAAAVTTDRTAGRGRVMSVASLFPELGPGGAIEDNYTAENGSPNMGANSGSDAVVGSSSSSSSRSNSSSPNGKKTQNFSSLRSSDYYTGYIDTLTEHCSKTLHGFHHELRERMKECVASATDAMFRSHGSYQYLKGRLPYGERVLRVLQRVQALEYQLESFSRHQENMRRCMLSDHERLVKHASAAVIERRMAFLNTLKGKLSMLHRSNAERSRWLKKQVLKENSIKFQ